MSTPRDAERDFDSRTGLMTGWLKVWALALPAVVVTWAAAGPGPASLAAVVAPALILLAGHFRASEPPAAIAVAEAPRDGLTGLPMREAALTASDEAMRRAIAGGRQTACLVYGIDNAADLPARHGLAAFDRIVRQTAERLSGVMREGDRLFRIGTASFAVVLAPVRRADLETLIQISGRLREAAGQPFSIDAATIYVSGSVGFCLQSRLAVPTGSAALAAAELAADEALRNGPAAVRSYSVEIEKTAAQGVALAEGISEALETGKIVGYFQPQLSCDTGEVTGFEVLARWLHPERGVLTPGDFLPAIHAAGLSTRLSEVMLFQALAALRTWDAAGIRIPAVAVNFSKDELADPNLTAKLKWELDRFEIMPARLTVEILESVVTETDADVVVRNVAALSQLGCGIDLDDFGTGHASIASMRRFAVDRIKIDRSFVTKVDSDESQRRMITAVLTMAERLGIETLAEGVETIGEHAMLAQLGCNHVQGFGIARPMPLDETTEWLSRHRSKLATAPQISRKAV